MAVYRFLAYDLRTNAALQELPLVDVEFGQELNGAGDLRATLPVDAATVAIMAAATIPERTVVYVERDGVLLGGYIIWQRTRRPGESIQLSGKGIESLLRRNRLVTDLTYTATDQFTIARALVSAMQAQAGGDVGITVGTGTCGVTRDRTFWAYERKNIGDAIDQLAAVENGFDWAIDVSWDTSSPPVPAKNLTLSYPRRGRVAGSTGVVFEAGKNLLGYTYTEDGTRSARSVDALGAGDGADMRISTATRTDVLDAGFPLTAETLSFKDITVQSTLDAHATAAVAARAATPAFLELVVDPDDFDAGLGRWIVGDDALVQITDDVFPLQPDGTPGYRRYHRIVAWSASVPQAGKELVTVTLGQVPG